jgi:hypothetical protein
MHPLRLITILAFASLAACSQREATVERAPITKAEPAAVGRVIDAVTEDGRATQFRIESIEPDPQDHDGDVSLYTLVERDAASGEWHRYCAPDAEGKSRAIPVQGSWDATGAPRAASRAITFACTSGAIAKCIRFGYKPWKEKRGVSLASHHTACMRMVRADYCGNGVSHTKDGTRIDLWDSLGVQTRDERADQPEIFEAVWDPNGAAYLNTARLRDDVAAIVQECPEKLRGRNSVDARLTVDAAREKYPEGLIFNARFVRDEDRQGVKK